MTNNVLLKKLKNFWNDEEGQSTTEYILILAIVVMIAMKFKTKIETSVGTLSDKVTGGIDNMAGDALKDVN